MSIYPSLKALPYVYLLIHKITREFYYGYREANKEPSHIDLPEYKTSSAKVKELGFENFDWIIIAEFFNGDDAFDFEQRIIENHIRNPLCLNRHFVKFGNNKFKNKDNHSQATKLKQSYAAKRNLEIGIHHSQRIYTCPYCDKTGNGNPMLQHHFSKCKFNPDINPEYVKKENNRIANLSKSHCCKYKVQHPSGMTEITDNLKQFCLKYKLNPQCMYKVSSGLIKQHKGFTCSKL